MNTIFRWLFEKTRIGQLINERKTELGVTFSVLWLLLAGLLTGAQEAQALFPDMHLLNRGVTWLTAVDALVGEALKFLGLSLAGVGVVHARLKQKGA